MAAPSAAAAAAAAADMPSFPGHVQVSVMHEPSVKLTRGHSCVLCQQRKVRCDKNKPCANCVKAGVDCKVVPPLPPRRRKKKPHERELIERLRKYESLLSQHGVDFEPIGNSLKASDSATVDEIDEIEHGIDSLKTSSSCIGQDNERNPKWFPYYKDFQTSHNSLGDSSDESSDSPMIHQAFDKMFDGQDGFPFVIGGSTASVTDLHPPAVQIFQLWQLYLDNVNPLLKITHTPTLQAQLIEAAANPAKIPKPLEALLFSIYFIAITSMSDAEVSETFKEDRNRMLSKFHKGTQQALINAGFMRSPDLVVLQAYVLYLLAIRQYMDPRSLFCLIGIAVRCAHRLGLHRDAEQFNLAPFEVEMRRRLWWQLVIYDKRFAEITGSAITALSSSKGDCKWPLNINDTDLHLNAKDRVIPYSGPTEMFFSLTRFELTVAANPDGIRPVQGLGATTGKPKFQYSPSPSSSDVFTNAATHNLPVADVDSYVNYIEDTYLKHCDPKIPLHLFTLLMTRSAISKLRVIDYLCRGYLQQHQDPNSLPPGPERTLRESVFEEAIRTIEYDNMIQSHEALQGFRWYTYMHFPFPAYIFLVGDLRYITTGKACECAWATIIENHDRRNMMKILKNPMHTAMGGPMVKAWESHSAAEIQLGRPRPPEPKLVGVMRDLVKKMKSSGLDPNGGGSSVKSGKITASSSKTSVSTTAGTTSSNDGYIAPQQQHQQAVDMDMRSTGSSPPVVSGPAGSGGGVLDPLAAGQVLGGGGGGFDGMHQNMFGAPMIPGGDMDFGLMDWSMMTPWGGGYLGPGGYEYPTPNMAAFPGQ